MVIGLCSDSDQEEDSGKVAGASPAYPTYSWEEDPPGLPGTAGGPIGSAFLHEQARLEGVEAILPDMGAAQCLCSSAPAGRMTAAAPAYGYMTERSTLTKPKCVSGVDGVEKPCTQQARIPGCLESGDRKQ